MSTKIKEVTKVDLENNLSKKPVSNTYRINSESQNIDSYEFDNEKSECVFDFKAENFDNPEKQSEKDIKRYNKYMSDIYLTLKESNLFTTNQITGIMANMRHETLSFFNPGTNYERVGSSDPIYSDLYYYDAKTGEKIDLDLKSEGAAGRALKSRGIPSKGGIGILQWTGKRKEEYIKWCNENNYEWDDAKHQVEYFIKEYTSTEWSSFRNNFEKTTSASEATKVFCIDFENPEDPYNEAERRSKASTDLIYQAINNYENNN